jgi:hypothetical protein
MTPRELSIGFKRLTQLGWPRKFLALALGS